MNRKYIDVTGTIAGFDAGTALSRARGLEGGVKQLFLDSEKLTPNANKGNMFLDSLSTKNNFADGLDGFYAQTGFDLFETTPNLPLSAFFYQGNIGVKFGGGLVDTISVFRINHNLTQGRAAGGNTNDIPTVSVDHQKVTVPAYVFKYGLIFGHIELMRAAKIAYDVLGHNLEALRMSWQKEIEYFAFIGNEGIQGITPKSRDFFGGLLNQKEEDILGIEVLDKDWADIKNAGDWTELIISAFTKILVAMQYDTTKTPNTIAVPSDIFEIWSRPGVVGNDGQAAQGSALALSIADYIERQLSKRASYPVRVVELPYLSRTATKETTTAGIVANGTNGTGRIVFYRNDESVMRIHIPMELTGGQYAWSPTEDAFRQNYVGLIAPLLIIYPSLFYIDNGKATE